MTQTIQDPDPLAADLGAPTKARTRHTRLHAQIISYLARNGASRTSDIVAEVSACRETLSVHLKVLEEAGVIKCNLPPGARARSTPFYSLQPVAPQTRGGQGISLTARVKEAADGKIGVAVDELPELSLQVRTFNDIPDAVAMAAATVRRRPRADFTVRVTF